MRASLSPPRSYVSYEMPQLSFLMGLWPVCDFCTSVRRFCWVVYIRNGNGTFTLPYVAVHCVYSCAACSLVLGARIWLLQPCRSACIVVCVQEWQTLAFHCASGNWSALSSLKNSSRCSQVILVTAEAWLLCHRIIWAPEHWKQIPALAQVYEPFQPVMLDSPM